LIQFETLSDKKKKILKLRFYENKTYDQIASELNITRSTVIDHVNQAIKKMQKKARKAGILTVLVPWRWNFSAVQKLMLKNSYMEVASIVLCLAVVAGAGYSFVEYSTPNSDNNTVHKTRNQLILNQTKDLTAVATHPDTVVSVESDIEKLIRQLGDVNVEVQKTAEKKLFQKGNRINATVNKVFSKSNSLVQEKILYILKMHYINSDTKKEAALTLQKIADENSIYTGSVNDFLNPLENIVDGIEGIR